MKTTEKAEIPLTPEQRAFLQASAQSLRAMGSAERHLKRLKHAAGTRTDEGWKRVRVRPYERRAVTGCVDALLWALDVAKCDFEGTADASLLRYAEGRATA